MCGRKNFKIVAMGDSITQGFPYSEDYSWVNIVSQRYNVPIINCGICGDFTSGMLARFHSDVISERPDAVIILGAYNDAFSDILPETVIANFEKMCSLSIEHNIIPVMGLPTPVSIPFIEDLLTEYRRGITDYAQKNDIKLINFYNTFIDPISGRLLTGTTTDGAHPTVKGYKLMSEAVELDKLFPDF